MEQTGTPFTKGKTYKFHLEFDSTVDDDPEWWASLHQQLKYIALDYADSNSECRRYTLTVEEVKQDD